MFTYENPGFLCTVVVGFWDKHLEVYDVSTEKKASPQLICKTDSLKAVARSLLFTHTGGKLPHILAGLSSGSVVVFALTNKQLIHQRIIPLGELPVKFCPFEMDAKPAIFCGGTHTAVITWENNRLQHSPVILKVCVPMRL